jgi:hypothetical protein
VLGSQKDRFSGLRHMLLALAGEDDRVIDIGVISCIYMQK